MILHYLGKQETRKLSFFHLNVACFFTKKTQNIVKNITWSKLNHLHYKNDRLGAPHRTWEHSILLSVTHMLYINQLCHGVSHFVKGWSCSSSSLQ